jgi:SAM-dependent methyltransferase
MSDAPSTYIHGTTPDEQARLATLNDLLNRRCLSELNLRGGERVLDVGSGLGQLARLMAGRTGTRVVGVERSPDQIGRAVELSGEANLVDFRQGLAEDLPLADAEWGTFDLAHTRFVLEHVRDPLAVVRQMVRAVRPGGRVVLTDDDHAVLRLYPDPPGADALWRAYVRSYDRIGNDPYVGRRLTGLLHDAGADPVRATVIPFTACGGEADFPAYAANLVHILVGARAEMLATGEVTPTGFDAGLAHLREWGSRPDAVFWYALPWAEGARR